MKEKNPDKYFRQMANMSDLSKARKQEWIDKINLDDE